MGLDCTVGALAEFAGDSDAIEFYEEEFRGVSECLLEVGLPIHSEPSNISPAKSVSYDLYGYSGVHYLRRIAALIWFRKRLTPVSEGENPSENTYLNQYYNCLGVRDKKSEVRFCESRATLLFQRRFDHLIYHSDCGGYYLPIEMKRVLLKGAIGSEELVMIGSSQSLLRELLVIAKKLHIPLELDPESDEVCEAAEQRSPGAEGWRRFGIESYVCLRLIRSAKLSIETGSAIVFH